MSSRKVYSENSVPSRNSNINSSWSRVNPNSNNSLYRSYGGWPNYMHSHGLRPWNVDDVDEGRAITQALQDARLSSNGHSTYGVESGHRSSNANVDYNNRGSSRYSNIDAHSSGHNRNYQPNFGLRDYASSSSSNRSSGLSTSFSTDAGYDANRYPGSQYSTPSTSSRNSYAYEHSSAGSYSGSSGFDYNRYLGYYDQDEGSERDLNHESSMSSSDDGSSSEGQYASHQVTHVEICSVEDEHGSGSISGSDDNSRGGYSDGSSYDGGDGYDYDDSDDYDDGGDYDDDDYDNYSD
ncbi:hypothetical protein C8Q75DRAFT_735066 [Abortiporus biennis]|nr:hypothetical protein C8Q75DRAFT_735066 [Abortiporus biennis]